MDLFINSIFLCISSQWQSNGMLHLWVSWYIKSWYNGCSHNLAHKHVILNIKNIYSYITRIALKKGYMYLYFRCKQIWIDKQSLSIFIIIRSFGKWVWSCGQWKNLKFVFHFVGKLLFGSNQSKVNVLFHHYHLLNQII